MTSTVLGPGQALKGQVFPATGDKFPYEEYPNTPRPPYYLPEYRRTVDVQGGTVSGTVFGEYSSLTLESGTATGNTVTGGAIGVYGGTLSDTVVNGGGLSVTGGAAVNTTVTGGYSDVRDAGVINGVAVAAGAKLGVGRGGTVTGAALDAGARLYFASVFYTDTATVTYDAAARTLSITSAGQTGTIGVSDGYAGATASLYQEVVSNRGSFTFYAGLVLNRPATGPGFAATGRTMQIFGSGNVVRPLSGTVLTNSGTNTVLLSGGGGGAVQALGTDTVFGGSGAASITAAGAATVVGSAGAMTVQGGTGTSVVFAGSGGLTYTGGTGYGIAVGLGNTLNVQGGTGGGQYWGGGGGTLRAGAGAQSVLVGASGDQLYSDGAAGNFLVATGDGVLLSGAGATGKDVMIGAGAGRMTFIAGSGDVLMGLDGGTNMVTLGAGLDTVFAQGTSTITAGSGSATVALAGQVNLVIGAGSGPSRLFALFNYVPGADRITLQGFGAGEAARAVATQTTTVGSAVLTLSDQSRIVVYGTAKVDAGLFA